VSFCGMQEAGRAGRRRIKAASGCDRRCLGDRGRFVNPTTNVGRLVMTLKPRANGGDDVSVVVARLKAADRVDPGPDDLFSAGPGRADLDPVQPLRSISTPLNRHRCSAGPLWANNLIAELRRDPLFRDVSSEAQEGGLRAALTSTASAPASSASASSCTDTLNDAFAQRQISTIYDRPTSNRVGAGGAADVPAGSVGALEAATFPAQPAPYSRPAGRCRFRRSRP